MGSTKLKLLLGTSVKYPKLIEILGGEAMVRLWLSAQALSIPKCAIIKSLPDGHTYLLNDIPIAGVSSYKGLGIQWDNDLKFRAHISETVKTSNRLCNMILCTFVIEYPTLYIQLFNALM